jgi:hypothetical protein
MDAIVPILAAESEAGRRGKADDHSGAMGCGGRSIDLLSVSISMKLLACLRSSSLAMGGVVRMLETTVTLTPDRWTLSATRRKSPSPDSKKIWLT